MATPLTPAEALAALRSENDRLIALIHAAQAVIGENQRVLRGERIRDEAARARLCNAAFAYFEIDELYDMALELAPPCPDERDAPARHDAVMRDAGFEVMT